MKLSLPPAWEKARTACENFGYEKTRRAVAALSLSFFVTVYLMMSLQVPEGWGAAFVALSGCYLVAFIGLAAEWFWGRWFAGGLGWSGVMVSVLSIVMLGWIPPLVIYGVLHGLVVLMLMGKKVAALYDQQEGWQQRFGMDEYGVARLGKTVTRAAGSLPSLILYVLGPKDPGQGMVHALFLVAVAGLGVVGLTGLLRLRTWGAAVTLASAVALVVHGGFHCAPELQGRALGELPAIFTVAFQPVWGLFPGMIVFSTALGTLVPGLLLLISLAPIARPALAFLRRR